jgi:hypothetical protein
MTASKVWSWADVPGLDKVQIASALLRQQRPVRGRPKHPVTLGQHDDVIILMARHGERIVHIASEIDCDERLISRRLQALGVEFLR